MNADAGRDQVAALVSHFKKNRAAYVASSYKEAHARQEFIDPFFIALGWDVRNERRTTPHYREVIPEDSLDVEGQKKAPDYAFRVGTETKFFVEAKKPGVNVKNAADAAWQLRRYGWTAGLGLSILTDFEELAIYDCRNRPAEKDKAKDARIDILGFEEYLDRWREIWDVFSRDAVWDGSFDKHAQAAKGRRGTAPVDVEFLKEIEGWRDELARNIALRNPRLGIDELNDVVQRTIDRIVFLRMAEDRGIEKEGLLKKAASGDGVYGELVALFRKADRRYNSGLFDFSRAGDTTTPGVVIDDKVLRGILDGLYFPKSPYVFSVLPAEILGSVYERFLGKVIRLTAGHRAKVEEKPEVKKSGGVVYTPSYIVRAIVEESLAPLVRDRSPAHLEGFRVLDPACGSGSFLLQAYQFLLDHYLGWYVAHDPTKHRRVVWQHGTAWRLTTEERKRILTAHIFGVDIDPQAVEVTKLSLLLRVLEGESAETLGKQMELFEARALPSLERNVRCGNSLIGPDFFAGRILPEREDLRRIKPFDWPREFPEAMSARGFDCVIGNPPYIRIQTMQEWAPAEVEIYKALYSTAAEGNYDIYVAFVEKGLQLLAARGRLGFILPHRFFNAEYGRGLRGLLAKGKHVAGIVHFGHQQVFENASTYTCILFLHKGGSEGFTFRRVGDLAAWRATGACVSGAMNAGRLTDDEWYLITEEEAPLFDRLSAMPVTLADVTSRIFQGIKTSADKIYIVEERERRADRVKVFSPAKEAEYWIEPDLLHPLIKGGDSRRYQLTRTNRLILFPYVPGPDGVALIEEDALKKQHPLTYAYLRQNKDYLEEREDGKVRGPRWYGYIYPKALDVMSKPKLFTPDIAARAAFSFDETGDLFFTGGVAGGYGILPAAGVSPKYLLGLLNSILLEWFLRLTGTAMRGGYYSYEARFIRGLPVAGLDTEGKPLNSARHDRLVALVEQMITLRRYEIAATGTQEREQHRSQVAAAAEAIDRLVYEIYGLTPQDVALVECLRHQDVVAASEGLQG